ncbi:MAG: 50S ribosomal protein L22 [Planctomycetota bacterium]
MSEAQKTYRALHRFAPIAPRKARAVAALVRGLPVNDALAVLQHTPRRAATLFHKVVKSALANAGQDLDVDLNALVVHDARADGGPLLGGRPRWRPRAMGRATPIRKRTSHLVIALAESAARRRRRAAPAAAESGAEGAPAAAE